VGTSSTLANVARHCIEDGCALPLPTFEEGCRLAAGLLGNTLDDELLASHFTDLLRRHDRLAAVMLLLPGNWGYTIHRNNTGQTTATVVPPYQASLRTVQSNEEGAALLAAIAVSLGATISNVRPSEGQFSTMDDP
jgi:hypothetical protein